MKTLIKILCLSVLWVSCEDQDIYGCTDSDACNFNEDATIFDNSCEYIVGTLKETDGKNIINLGINPDC